MPSSHGAMGGCFGDTLCPAWQVSPSSRDAIKGGCDQGRDAIKGGCDQGGMLPAPQSCWAAASTPRPLRVPQGDTSVSLGHQTPRCWQQRGVWTLSWLSQGLFFCCIS